MDRGLASYESTRSISKMKNCPRNLGTFSMLFLIQKPWNLWHAFLNSGVKKYQSCFHKWETGNTDYILSNLSTFYHGIPEYRDRKIRRSLTQKLPEEFDEKFTKDDVKLANNRWNVRHWADSKMLIYSIATE